MPIIETKRSDIRALEGVHLFHFATSNCSQRVRFFLEEKGVDWESHHIDLIKCENATPEFAEINPKAVVPVLVHDGKTITESNDIIRYVDQNFDGPSLHPESSVDEDYLQESFNRSSGFQDALRVLTYEFLFKPFRRMSKRELEDYEKGTNNVELVEFMREFSARQGFGYERISAAVRESELILASLEKQLEGRDWLTGDSFGLTDISWVVNFLRFEAMHYPMNSYPQVTVWLQRVRARPTFKRAISHWESRKMAMIFNGYSWTRRLRRSSVRTYISLL